MPGPLALGRNHGAGATTRFSGNFRWSRVVSSTLTEAASLLSSRVPKVPICWRKLLGKTCTRLALTACQNLSFKRAELLQKTKGAMIANIYI